VDADVRAGRQGGRAAGAAAARAAVVRVVPVLDWRRAGAVRERNLRAGGVLGDGDDLADEGELCEERGKGAGAGPGRKEEQV